MKVLTVIGARPQFIKAAVVSRAFVEHRPDVHEILVHTGQHYDANMSDVFFDELGIPLPDHNLGIGGGTHGQNTGRMLEKLEALMQAERPDWVLVYGDTDSTLAGALASAKLHIPVAHVEAGLRSFNRYMPEEINRVLTDHVAALLFAPSEVARTNLCNEGIANDRIRLVGDVMYDAALFYNERARKPAWFDSLSLRSNEFVLCTIHRAENTDQEARMQGIFDGLGESGLPIILPLHPRTSKKLTQMNVNLPANVTAVDPVGYLEMVWLEANCKIIATDSGGVQKEAYFHKKPCITLRDETEWVELIEGGYNALAGANSKEISNLIRSANFPRFESNIYGSGDAGRNIVEWMCR
ncbi:UDP-N-acetylglucosamine 2-epimerase (non-hydrolyzing) [Cupriavidus basilensis]|uniref:UDP-N-acetylglucosamine 2-epimerase (Non-hydrolyzing) n=1 Tax=Cupriavidus basilensis TaxID=68895 RepID=A0ABT6B210_9BURK|nr:UDP-N-acetylglucosamine 2-epimerase (non-hydrolyzing) [Cupriavidus basilensis]MDF3838764.1 UDP-N-acetylglucosamine 2-epimerase (non-hydrolyzing) [Cupriavidus basilensis]